MTKQFLLAIAAGLVVYFIVKRATASGTHLGADGRTQVPDDLGDYASSAGFWHFENDPRGDASADAAGELL